MDLLKTLEDKIDELSQEVEALIGKKEKLSMEIKNIDIRIIQITGAIDALNSVINKKTP